MNDYLPSKVVVIDESFNPIGLYFLDTDTGKTIFVKSILLVVHGALLERNEEKYMLNGIRKDAVYILGRKVRGGVLPRWITYGYETVYKGVFNELAQRGIDVDTVSVCNFCRYSETYDGKSKLKKIFGKLKKKLMYNEGSIERVIDKATGIRRYEVEAVLTRRSTKNPLDKTPLTLTHLRSKGYFITQHFMDEYESKLASVL